MTGDPLAAGLFSDGVTLLLLNVLLWIISLRLGKTWPVDFIWSTWPLLQCIRIISRQPEAGCGPRQACVCLLVSAWGMRLTLNFIVRGGIGHEDWRYVAMRKQFGAQFWWVSLFSVFLGQSIFMFAACLPLYAALLIPTAMTQWSDVLGFGVSTIGILLEFFADRQMDAYKAAKSGHVTVAPVIDRGLWLWSRHPNYFGEMMWWWGLWLFTMGSTAPVWVVSGPCGITLLFNLISVQLMEHRQRQSKGKAYEMYQLHVPSCLVPIPPAMSRWLSRWCALS